jgi:hypothetical protein
MAIRNGRRATPLPAYFYKLPAELQIQVFDYLHAADIKRARAVSRKFRDNTTPALFRRVVACARYQALGALQNVSLHSVYSRYVREIMFDGSMYDEQLAYSDRAYYAAEEKLENPDFCRGFWRRTRFKRYQELYQDQKDMDEVILQELARGLEAMQNISSIVYSPHQHLVPTERKDLRDLLPRGAYQGLPHSSRVTASDHPFRQLIGAVYLSQYTGIRKLIIEAPPDDEPSTKFSLAIFAFPDPNDLKAGQHLFRQLISLDLNVSLDGPGASTRPMLGHGFGGHNQGPGLIGPIPMPHFNPPNFPPPLGHNQGQNFGGPVPGPHFNPPNFHFPPHFPPPPGHHPIPPVGGAHVGGFTGGPNAGMGVSGPAPITIAPHTVAQILAAAARPAPTKSSKNPPQGAIRQLQNLTRCLRAARDLRHLSFCIPDWSDNAREMYGHIFPDGRPIFYSLGLWFTWSKLRSMSLEGIYADERDIINLIQRHSNTPRTLNLTKCSLCTGTWAKVVDEVITNASMITTFSLDRVNEAAKMRGLDDDDRESWRYEGHLVVSKNGDREFVRTE